MITTTSCESIYARLGLPDAPLVVDVREESDYLDGSVLVPGAIRGSPNDISRWSKTLPRARSLAVYCKHGGHVSQGVCTTLAAMGFPAAVMEGGIERWIQMKYATVRSRADLNAPGSSRWVTRERPKIDRLACPWLVRRFIDPHALFFYAPAHRVRDEARALGAQPYDIADVEFTHRGPACSFDAFLDEFDLHDPVVSEVADVVRAADTGRLADSPQAPGLLAISLGLSANITDDVLLLEQAMPVYDALYAWRKLARNETHSWPAKVA